MLSLKGGFPGVSIISPNPNQWKTSSLSSRCPSNPLEKNEPNMALLRLMVRTNMSHFLDPYQQKYSKRTRERWLAVSGHFQ